MIRSTWIAAGILWLAGSAEAQPLGVPPVRGSLDWRTKGIVSTVEQQAETESVQAGTPPTRSFEELRRLVTVGDTLYVLDATGGETKGRDATFSDIAITVTVEGTRREFMANSLRRIERRRRDPVRNGVLIGAATGALLGFRMGRGLDSPTCPRPGSECGQGSLIGTVGGAVWGALGGWLTDALVREREVIYLANDPK